MTRRTAWPWEKPFRMTRAEIAALVFRRSESWLIDHMPADFPKPEDDLYLTEAVENWCRQKHGLAPAIDDAHAAERRLMERAGGKVPSALPRRPAA